MQWAPPIFSRLCTPSGKRRIKAVQRLFRCFWPPFLGVLLAGCASQPPSFSSLDTADDLPPRTEIEAVPFFAQKRHHCGPASLAMVLNHHGVPRKPAELAPEVYLPAREGSLGVEMLASARRQGMLALRLEGEMSALFREVAAGHPVVVLQNLGLNWFPRWHYAVVVGFDREAGEVILRSGLDARRVTGMGVFERTWARSGHWAMIVLPPGRLPVASSSAAVVTAAAGLERLGMTAAALKGYRSAARRWPDDHLVLMALGNGEYAIGNHARAEAAFRRDLGHHPGAAEAWNNLAYALAEQGCLQVARKAVECATRLEPDNADYRASLEELSRQRQGSRTACRPVECPRASTDGGTAP